MINSKYQAKRNQSKLQEVRFIIIQLLIFTLGTKPDETPSNDGKTEEKPKVPPVKISSKPIAKIDDKPKVSPRNQKPTTTTTPRTESPAKPSTPRTT